MNPAQLKDYIVQGWNGVYQVLAPIVGKIVSTAEKAAAYIWQIALRQNLYFGVMDIVGGIVALIIGVYAYRSLQNVIKNGDDSYGGWTALYIVVLIGSIVALLVLFLHGFYRLCNPEISTAQDLINTARLLKEGAQ